ncbi:aromatic aminobenezylarsenical efflux permease ArsG family transporter [Crateriforma conspicua]|uniref:Cytochrome C biogenesis protein transmembrane region n=1 Tax=Crateriforma conspicua TaxID=2527996 RepID=A0A5C6FWR4_9PLAN|nr:aromatic aminobenezylarsenical efflux permease ArsG family transporter [Crateriforma conspicua]TWU66816.1 Cytochrome C biogenesis protein transmembrane region [Crateriforma conspicua]
MIVFLTYTVAALYLGFLTSISPCPLATNIAAISYIGSKVDDSRHVIHAGLLYTLGRCLLYIVLAGVLALGSLSMPTVSLWLQKYMHLALGPVFLVLGMLLSGVVVVSFGGGMMSDKLQQRVDAMGIWAAFPLGVLFAISFCPTSAAWFFGLLALTFGADSGAISSVTSNVGIELPQESLPGGALLLPLVYGIGTAFPVLVLAFLLAFSAKTVGKTFQVLTQMEWWARTGTGWLFILLGVYFSLAYVFEVSTVSV